MSPQVALFAAGVKFSDTAPAEKRGIPRLKAASCVFALRQIPGSTGVHVVRYTYRVYRLAGLPEIEAVLPRAGRATPVLPDALPPSATAVATAATTCTVRVRCNV